MTEIKDAFEEFMAALDDMAPMALALESAMLLGGAAWLTLALRALG